MQIRIFKILSCLLLCLSSAPVHAQEFVVGIGYTDYPDAGEDSAIVALEYRHTPFFERGPLSTAFGATLSVTGETDVFIGAGVATRLDLNDKWFLDTSFMPGFHREGIAGNNLGTTLEFRSLLGVGYRFESGAKVSVALTHKSNASLDAVNPGADVLLIRFHRDF